MKMYHPRTRRQGRRRVAVLAAAVTAAALALTGCTPAAEPESGNVTLDIGGAAGQMQENWNPYGFSTPVIMAAGFVFEPLVQYNALNADETYPWLAKEYKWSDDYTSLTFTLREGVNWSDGKPFTANDVVFTFNLLKNNPGMNFRQVQFDSVEALSDSEVRLNFASNSFSQQLPIFSTYIVPEHVWANQADPMAFTNPDPVGTGPFTVASFDPSNILFDRNEDYWQEDKPVVDHLRLTSYNSDQSATLAFTKGDVDWIGISGDPAQFESADPEHLVAWTPSFMTSFMIFNTTQAPFDNALVRKALSMALNRDQIVQAATQGTSKVAHPTGLVLPNMESWLDPEFADLAYEQDLDEALALFKEAGYEQDSDGRLLTPEGQQFGFSILSSSGFTQDVTQGQVIKDQLGKLGIAVNLELVPQEEATSRGETGDFQVAFGNSGQFDPMPGNVYNNLLNSSFAAPIGTETRGNYGRWKDPETDALLQKYRTAESDEARREAVQDIQQIMVDEVPIAPIYYQNAMSETSSREVTGWPGEDDPYSAGTFVLGPWASLIVSRLELAD